MSEPTPEPAAYYVRTGPSSYRPTVHAQGAWSPREQHMGPIAGLMSHVLEGCAPREDLAMSRVTFDISGVPPLDEVTVTAEVVRPGRTIELLEATMVANGRTVVTAHAWRLLRGDTRSLAGVETPAIAEPERATPWDGTRTWSGGFIASLELRVLPGWRPGRGQVWIRPRVPVIDDADISDVSRLLGAVDTMNGVAVRTEPSTLAFPNTDLTIHLFRQPTGDWVGIDVEVTFGPDGVGMTSAVLSDESGPFGRALQILTLRPQGRPLAPTAG